MKKYINSIGLLLLALLAFKANAKQRSFYGRIMNKDGIGLPMAVVESKDHTYRFQANSNGIFNFKADPDSIDFFIFSAHGFTPMDFLVEDLPDDSIIIELKKRENDLQTAVIGAKGNKIQLATAGISKGGNSAGCYLNIYDEIAVYLDAAESERGMLREVGAFIDKGGVANSDFKLHIYAKDSATGAPGQEITDSILIVHARKGNEWVRVDLSQKFIQVHGGVFVSMEWIIGEKNDFFAYSIPPGNTNYYSGEDSLRQTFNGQVLGMDWQDKQPKVYRRYASNIYEHKNEGKWYLTAPLLGGHKGGRGWIAPMLYYTYSYIDK